VRKRWTCVLGLRLAAVGLVITLAACGGNSPSTTPTTTPATTTTTTQPPAGITLSQGNELIPNRQLFLGDVKVEQVGRLDITIEYTFADSQILFWLTDRKCTRQWFENDECDYLTKSLGGPTPRTVTVPSVKVGTYTFFVSNDGPHDEQVKYRIVLTP
jgi:hypothetical protein